MATLFLSQGVPMLVAGDEISRTQMGNNNAYCQDNEISWLNWETADKEMLDFTRKIIHFRKNHPIFRRRRWFQGEPLHKLGGLEDIEWFLPEGAKMTQENWTHDFAKSLGVYLNGQGIRTVGPRGEQILDDSFYVIFNAYHDKLNYTLPPKKYGKKWTKILDTAKTLFEKEGSFGPKQQIVVEGRSVVVLQQLS